jgi:hypothetical protein
MKTSLVVESGGATQNGAPGWGLDELRRPVDSWCEQEASHRQGVHVEPAPQQGYGENHRRPQDGEAQPQRSQGARRRARGTVDHARHPHAERQRRHQQ